MRNLTKTLAAISLLMPASAYPLGIGEIKLHSALNQNLDAEISLVLSPGEKLADINVNLASPDKFDENGVPWTYFLSKIKIETVASNGSAVIKISSKEALKEPFLDFLLEVSWAKGNLFREFTVLVDPPEVYKQAAIPIISTPSDDYGSERNYAQQSVTRKSPSVVESSGISADGYGPTTKNDTLWKIAQQVSRGSEVSVEQMLIALYEENPHAFYKANVNALLAGKVLKVPERDVILKLSRKQAVSEFNKQIQAWRNNQAQEITTVDSTQNTSVDNQLTLIAPAQDSVLENATVTSGSGQKFTQEKKPSNVASVASDGDSSKKSADTSAPVDNTIQDKIAVLEKQLAIMQELVALKDQQLASLQNQSQVIPPPLAITEKTIPTDIGVTKPEALLPEVTKPIKPLVDVQPKSLTPPVPAPTSPLPIAKPVARPVERSKIPVEDGAVDWYYLGVGGAGAGLLAGLGWLWWRQRKPQGTEDSINAYMPAGLAKADKSADSFSDSIDENYGFDLSVGENIFASDFAAGDFDVIDMDQGEIDPISEADVYLAYGRYQQAEDLIRDAIADQPERDECKLKLLEIFYANGNKRAFEIYASELIDAGKQSDIGFWAKVAEMGNDVCADSPLFSVKHKNSEQKDSKSFENSNQASVETDADELTDDMSLDMASFEKLFDSHSVPDMFGEDNNVFDIGSVAFEEEPQSSGKNDESKQNNENIDFDMDMFAVDNQVSDQIKKVENKPVVVTEQDMFAEVDSFFDINNLSFEDKSEAFSINDEPTKNNESIDFDLSLFAVDPQEPDKTNKPVIADEFESFDFDFSEFDTKENENENETFDFNVTEPFELGDSFHAIDFSTDDKNEEFKVEDTLSENSGAADLSTDKKFGFEIELDSDLDNNQDSFDDFDFNAPEKLNGQNEKSFGISDLAEMDEMETKLDLAIAYIDMGDTEAAKEIALDVLKKGTPEQRMIAQALVDSV